MIFCKCSAEDDRYRKWKNLMTALKCSAEGDRFRNWKDQWAHKSSTLKCLFISRRCLLSSAGGITSALNIWIQSMAKHTRFLRTAVPENNSNSKTRDKSNLDGGITVLDDEIKPVLDGEIKPVLGGEIQVVLDGGGMPVLDGEIKPVLEGEIQVDLDGGDKVDLDGGDKVNLDGHIKAYLDSHIKPDLDGHIKPDLNGHIIKPDLDGEVIKPSLDGEVKPSLDGLPSEIKGHILHHLLYEQISQLRTVSKDWQDLVESKEFQALSSREKPTLTASYFFIENEVWHWAGFDPSLKKWRRLPPLTFLPTNCKPDPDLFKEFLVCTKDGLVCINFSKSPNVERLIVFNPLSKRWTELPPLIHRRNPVLMHMLVDPDTQSYQVIVAGSCRSGDENLSKITEVFESRTGQWKRRGDLPGPLFSLNEYQSGVYEDGKLFCIGYCEDNDQVLKGIIAYNVKERRWVPEWTHPLSFGMNSTILQLVESFGEVYLFSERENGRYTEHWIDRLEWTLGNGDEKNTCMLINVLKKKKIGGRSLEVYPEYTCVPYSEGQLCILNAIDHTGVVYDIRNQRQSEVDLQELPIKGFRGELGFFSLNPMSFTVEPRFSSKVDFCANVSVANALVAKAPVADLHVNKVCKGETPA